MILRLVLKNIACGKVRFFCAVLGVAAAAGAIDFFFSLNATNDAQAPAIAARTLAPWQSWKIEGLQDRFRRGAAPQAREVKQERGMGEVELPVADLELPLVALSIDHRPGGRVLQGPPMRTTLAPFTGKAFYQNAILQGRWPDEKALDKPEIVATRAALTRFGRGEIPKLGATVKFIGEKGTLSATLVGLLEQSKTPASFPGVFANGCAFAKLRAEKQGKIRVWKEALSLPEVSGIKDIAPQFMTDSGRNMSRLKPLLLWAAAMTALCLLVNTLLLSVESLRREISTLRMVGMTSAGVVKMILVEAAIAGGIGAVLGCLAASLLLKFYTLLSPETFSEGAVFDWRIAALTAGASVAVSLLAALLALRPILSVRAIEAASSDECKAIGYRRAGMIVAFACGFGAFVAVEVWGGSLMKAFVPSPEWPDAIVSLLPGGVSPYDIDKLDKLAGVKRIGELQAQQVAFHPREELSGGRGGRQVRNALLLAGKPELMFFGEDALLPLRFSEGEAKDAFDAVAKGKACIITAMMARARKLKLGDQLEVELRGEVHGLKIAGIADLNWHMVTSRGLLRGMKGMPVNTDGPVFISFETMFSILPIPSIMSSMTHLWLRYRPDFVAKHGVFQAGRLVEQSIVERLGNPEGCAIRLHARDEIADGTLAHGASLIGELALVPFIFLAVLSIGFIAMLTAFAEASRREFAVLRAIGATRLQLVLRMIGEALAVALRGIGFALPGGMLAGWLFTFATRASMTNWGLPMTFALPFSEVFCGIVGALVFAMLVAAPVSTVLVAGFWRRIGK